MYVKTLYDTFMTPCSKMLTCNMLTCCVPVCFKLFGISDASIFTFGYVQKKMEEKYMCNTNR